MSFINKFFNFFKKNYTIIMICIKLAKEIEKKLDPNEKYQIDDKALDFLEKMLEKMKK